MKDAIDLGLTVGPNGLQITVINRSEQDLQLWARNNSWGWSMFSLMLARSDSNQWRELTAKPVRWTRNVPRVQSVPVGGELDYDLGYQDPSWESLEDIKDWLTDPLQVRVKLCIPETPEAVAQGVFVGEVFSSSCLSTPPHSWLSG